MKWIVGVLGVSNIWPASQTESFGLMVLYLFNAAFLVSFASWMSYLEEFEVMEEQA